MATVNNNKFNIINTYYNSGLSVKDIAKKLVVSPNAVNYFFRKHKIKRRNLSEARNAYYNNQAPSFKIKANLSPKERELMAAGIMLYWGEGSKWPGEKIVDFANSNTEMIKVFLNFLRLICGVQENKLRVYLYCYSNQKPQKLVTYWSNATNIPKSQFTKPYIRKDYKAEKKGKMKNGLIHIRYADKKLLDFIKDSINNYIGKLI